MLQIDQIRKNYLMEHQLFLLNEFKKSCLKDAFAKFCKNIYIFLPKTDVSNKLNYKKENPTFKWKWQNANLNNLLSSVFHLAKNSFKNEK